MNTQLEKNRSNKIRSEAVDPTPAQVRAEMDQKTQELMDTNLTIQQNSMALASSTSQTNFASFVANGTIAQSSALKSIGETAAGAMR